MKTATAAALSPAAWAAGVPRRPFGKTGLEVSILSLGGAEVGRLDDAGAAIQVVRRCYELGVNYFDTAASGAYGLSQVRYGEALKGIRDKVILGTKTRHRTATQAEIDLTQSLGNLKTDRIDVYQVHNVMNQEDVEFIFGPKGVMEMIEKAKKAGKIRFVGVTGHADPQILSKIISLYDFDTILLPLSLTDGANKEKSFERETLPLARKKNLGIIAMKTLGGGRILTSRKATLEECLRYVWRLPISTAVLGCQDAPQAEADARLAGTAGPMTAAEAEDLRRRISEDELAGLEPWKPEAGRPAYLAD